MCKYLENPLGAYLQDITRTPLLTAAEQRSAAHTVRKTQHALRQAMLGSEYVLRSLLAVARRVARRQSRVDRLLQLGKLSEPALAECRVALQQTVARVTALLDQNRADLAVVRDRRRPRAERAAAWHRVRTRRRQAADIAAAQPIHLGVLEQTLREVANLAKALRMVHEELAAVGVARQAGATAVRLRATRRRLMRLTGETPRSMQRYLQRVGRRGKRYDAACSRLATGNLRLVVSVARRYGGGNERLLDLIQEGNVGLMRAVEKFDPRRGCKFSTFATWWIRQAISKSMLDHAYSFRITTTAAQKCARLWRTIDRLQQLDQGRPTLQDVADTSGLSPAETLILQRVQHPPLSLDEPCDEAEPCDRGEILADPRIEQPAAWLDRQALAQRLQCLLQSLEPRERQVLTLRFGLGDNQPRTLQDVGAAMRLTRERVRQIEAAALAKLRTPRRACELASFFDAPSTQLLADADALLRADAPHPPRPPMTRRRTRVTAD